MSYYVVPLDPTLKVGARGAPAGHPRKKELPFENTLLHSHREDLNGYCLIGF